MNMRLIGLEFWLENNNEMTELYEEENYNILPKNVSKDDFIDHVRNIGDCACDNAFTILDQFSSRLIDVMGGNISIRRNTKTNKMRNEWTVQHVVWDSKKDNGKEWLSMIGATLDMDQEELVIWAWKKGGSSSEDFLLNLFSKHFDVVSRSNDYDYSSGNVIIHSLKLNLLCSGYKDNDSFVQDISVFENLKKITKNDWLKFVS